MPLVPEVPVDEPEYAPGLLRFLDPLYAPLPQHQLAQDHTAEDKEDKEDMRCVVSRCWTSLGGDPPMPEFSHASETFIYI